MLYNTYWVRFSHGSSTFDAAIANTRVLLDAAKRAGVRRIVHVSITNPSLDSPLPYFRGKALLERDIAASGLPHTILRPAVIFGDEDVLINNIAWILRRSPIFAVPGSGEYRLQPIFVEDLADLAVTAGASGVNEVIDAIGPETFTFNELLSAIRRAVHSRARVVHLPPALALQLSRLIGFGLRDVVLTPDEVRGLAADLLVTDSPPVAQTRLTDWLASHAASVGRQYASELKRHYR